MFLPTIFRNKKCNCGRVIEEDQVREIGVSTEDGKFLLRFKCPDCGLSGKITFPDQDRDIVQFCQEILRENEKKESGEKVKKSEFYREKLGCLYIPSWTNDSFNEFNRRLDEIDFDGEEPE